MVLVEKVVGTIFVSRLLCYCYVLAYFLRLMMQAQTLIFLDIFVFSPSHFILAIFVQQIILLEMVDSFDEFNLIIY